MRHRKKINHLGRKSEHRKAMLSNMATSLILKKRITTTLAKAKALKVYVEPLITKSKLDSTHSRRTVFSYLQNKYAVSELFRDVSQKIADRPGGYTRILKTGFRKGDGAEMCFIELVDYNVNMLKTSEDTQKKTRRSRRGKKASDAIEKAPAPAAMTKATETIEIEADTEAKDEIKAEIEAPEVEATNIESIEVDATKVNNGEVKEDTSANLKEESTEGKKTKKKK